LIFSIAGLDVQDAVIDGEIVALDDKGRPSFQLLQGFDMGLVLPPIVFYAFDLLRLDGKDLRGLPIEERKVKLAALLRPPRQAIRYSASFTELNKISVKDCPFFNLPATGRGLDPGLTVAEMRRCVWVKPKMVCQAKFTEWTRDDRLRQPVFLGLREDKNASEVVREQVSAATS
jgi:bifunctional non-homologous end joining protein LigD